METYSFPSDYEKLEAEARWDESMDTGMALVDEQHRRMFGQIARLLDRSQKDRIPETLDFMATYAVEHFGAEERLHRATDYPLAREHLDAHNAFIARFQELKREYDGSGGNLVILMKLSKFLLDWLREHIQGQDRQFADYFHRLRPENLPNAK